MSGASGGVGTGAVSSTVILNTLQSIVTAINGQTQTNTNLAGSSNFFNITTTTLIKSGQGRIVRISVIVAGSAVGHVYDTTSTTDTSRPLYVIPMTVGVVLVDIPIGYGIVIAPGSGQTVSGSYS